ncbi:The BTB (BR-C, ttk and bab)/POZ (Pox virus and Zinc finger) domain [Ceratobasidium sp. AG-Ba]|nr:The BTB (BR-C, ttk and bab)/POZ (Pox virus and Zinc finger) domain [Ceratobasidium sp. AG-Ba]
MSTLLPLGVRDSRYYFEDGSIIILAERTLFKIHRSLLSLHSDVFESMFKLPGHRISDESTSPIDDEGGSDRNPVIIPEIKASQLRTFLLYIYGTATNPEYRALIQAATEESANSLVALRRYLDVASLAHRFCLEDIESWALDQLKKLLQFSRKLSELSWSYSDMIDTLTYSKLTCDHEIQQHLRSLVYRSVCKLYILCSTYSDLKKPSTVYVISRFTQLFIHPTIKQDDPALFGLVFCLALSAGHRSLIWQNMTRDERAKLYAAQVHLTPLPPKLPLVWLKNHVEPFYRSLMEECPECFMSCSEKFFKDANPVVNRADLTSDSPLMGIRALCKLPLQRQQLESLKTSYQCACPTKILEMAYLSLDKSFKELGEKYQDCLV